MKIWYAFDMGSNGGISNNGASGPYGTRQEAEAWAMTRFPKSSVSQIAIAELVAVAERASPPITITDVAAYLTERKAA